MRVIFLLLWVTSFYVSSSIQYQTWWIAKAHNKGFCTLEYDGSFNSHEGGRLKVFIGAAYFGDAFSFNDQDITKGAENGLVALKLKVSTMNVQYPITTDLLEVKIYGNIFSLKKMSSNDVDIYQVIIKGDEANQLLKKFSLESSIQLMFDIPSNPEYLINISNEMFKVNHEMFKACANSI